MYIHITINISTCNHLWIYYDKQVSIKLNLKLMFLSHDGKENKTKNKHMRLHQTKGLLCKVKFASENASNWRRDGIYRTHDPQGVVK